MYTGKDVSDLKAYVRDTALKFNVIFPKGSDRKLQENKQRDMFDIMVYGNHMFFAMNECPSSIHVKHICIQIQTITYHLSKIFADQSVEKNSV